MSSIVVRRARSPLVLLVVLALAASASAQGYTVARATGLMEKPPSSATRLDVDSNRPEKSSAVVTLPFPFWDYGRSCSTVVVSAHGWVVPGATAGFADAADPTTAHGQDRATGAFPYVGAADGVIAPLWTTYKFVDDGSTDAGGAFTWTSGAAPNRRFVVSWENFSVGDSPRMTTQLQLFEGAGRIVSAYAIPVVTGAAPFPTNYVCGFDEPRGTRFMIPLANCAKNTGPPGCDFVFDPRTVMANAPDVGRVGKDVKWQHDRLESLSGEGSSEGCCYVAKGLEYFYVPDRAVRARPLRKTGLIDEDKATFPGGKGDAERWVRQVIDGKAILLLNDGAPVRVWFRVIECFTIDDAGIAGPDHHVWNLRLMLENAFPADDPRSKIDNYCAWRATASSRLDVVKVFDADQRDDAGRQHTTGRAGEYALWCARIKAGPRGGLADFEVPTAGWKRFLMKDDDTPTLQHADKGDLRFVVDPNYVDGHYAYVVGTDENPPGWKTRRKNPPPTMTDEPFDVDPGAGGEAPSPR